VHTVLIPLDAHPFGTHPGVYLRAYLKRRQIFQGAAAELLGISRQNLNAIIAGHRRITPDLAERLDALIGTNGDYWLTLQLHHDQWRARQRRQRAG
jgi:addiction module HigA family antidote